MKTNSVIFIESADGNLFESQLKVIAFNKIRKVIPTEFKGRPTLYDTSVSINGDDYLVTAVINNVGKSETDRQFVVKISRDELLEYLVSNLTSELRSVASSTWKY